MRLADLQQLLRPVLARIRALAARASLTRVDDSGLSQQVQITVLAGERLDQVVRLQNFGLSANPPVGSTALLVSIGGSRTHCVVLGADHASRPRDLLSGESQHYNQWGDYVYLQESGETLVKARSKVICEAPEVHAVASTKVVLDTPLVQATTDLQVDGNLAVAGTGYVEGAFASATSVADPAGDMAEMRSKYNSHRHGGVLPGIGTSGLPTVTLD